METKKSFSYDEAIELSKQYFNGEELSAKVFVDKYALRDSDGNILEATPDSLHERLAKEFARIDSEKYGFDYNEKYNEYFSSMKNFARIVPQGSPMAAIGNTYQVMSASNCVVVASPEDSVEGIMTSGLELAQLMKRRCVEENTLVNTKELGIVPISQVEVGMSVLSFDIAKRKSVFKKVLNKFNTEVTKEDRISIKFDNGTILKTSKKHPVLTFNKNGDYEYKNAGELTENCIGVKPELNDANFDLQSSKEDLELGWFIGAHIGDGTCGLHQNKYRFRILGDNEKVIEAYKNIFNKLTKSNSNYSVSTRKHYKTKCWEYTNSNSINEEIVKLIDHQIGSKTYIAKVPSIVKEKNLWWSFIAGLIDTDGHVRDSKTISIRLCTPFIIDEIACFLASKGISCYTYFIPQRHDRKNEADMYGITIHATDKILNLFKNIMHHDKKIEKMKSSPVRHFSNKKYLSKEEYFSIINDYENNFNGKKTGNLSACMVLLRKDKNYMAGIGSLNEFEKNGLISSSKIEEISQRVKIEKIAKDEGSSNYIDIEVEDTNNFYAGNFGLVNIHNCGVGIDISTLRPEGTRVNNAAKTTSGAWSFADFFSYVTRMIGQNNRRGALMVTMSVHHPDILKFITMKQDLTKVTGANISVKLTDEFLKAVDNDEEYELRFPIDGKPLVTSKVKAKDVWDVIVNSATKTAEPGMLMWDNIINNLPPNCYPQFKTISTNPCCFSQDSEVFIVTKEGIKEIKEITNSDEIWIDSEKVWAKTSGYFNAGTAEVFEVVFSNGEKLEITSNHKLEQIKGTRIGSKIIFDNPSLVELKDLSVGDRISVSINNANPELGNKGSYNEGLILGWLTGDGALSYKSNDAVFPSTYLAFWKKEYDVAEKMLKIVNSMGYPVSLNSYELNGNNVKRIVSEELTRDLVNKYEMNIWKFKKDFNPYLFKFSKEFIKGYLSAYFSADGTVTNTVTSSRYCIQLTSINKSLLHQVKNLLTLFGIKSSIGLNKLAGVASFRGKEYKTEDSYRLSITGLSNLKKFSSEIGFIAESKQKILDKIVKIVPQRAEKELHFVTIKSIKSIGIKEVGCIEVEKYHKFTANGLISGNSEIALSAFDSCRLISINLTGYVKNAFTKDAFFDLEMYKKDVRTAMQMADNLVDLELELIEKIINVCSSDNEKGLWKKLWQAGHDGRRTGLGTHGLADTLSQLCIRYDSDEASKVIDSIYKTLRDEAYGASVELAKTRGAFPVYNYDLEESCEFIQRLPEELKLRMRMYGRRNIAILTQAPTGSVSIVSKVGEFNSYNVSSGIEPVFRNSYTRRKKINYDDKSSRIDFVDVVGDKWQEFKVFHSNVRNYLNKFNLPEESELPDYFVTSDQINWEKRVELQGIEQQYVDHSISSTINLPKGTPVEVVSKLYLDAWKKGLKGVTVYVDGSRDGVLITEPKKEKVEKSGRPQEIVPVMAPKRPNILPCEIHQASVNGTKYNVIVSLLNDAPYEMFMGHSEQLSLPSKSMKGKVVKVTKGKYNLHVDVNGEDLIIKDIINTFDNKEMAWASRMISTSLRHGIPVDFLVEQLSKDGGIGDINKVISRILKKYIKEGMKVRSGVTCTSCNSAELVYRDGCQICMACGSGKCA
ncbi:MAG: hypothetical protein LC122_02490 [Chitinophagales bacterium]|nr:hypothetical protein [Chitinophagales bacterium]